jgi:hypothetical protein
MRRADAGRDEKSSTRTSPMSTVVEEAKSRWSKEEGAGREDRVLHRRGRHQPSHP